MFVSQDLLTTYVQTNNPKPVIVRLKDTFFYFLFFKFVLDLEHYILKTNKKWR